MRDQRPALEAYLRRIDAQIVDFTEHHYSVAAEAYLRFGREFNPRASLNYGDCLACAVAVLAGDKLLFIGEDFNRTDVLGA